MEDDICHVISSWESRTLLELTLPSFCTAFRGLLGQPVAMDAEVASTMAEVGGFADQTANKRMAFRVDMDREMAQQLGLVVASKIFFMVNPYLGKWFI